MRESRVLLAGAFGQRNPGDEALLTAFARELRERTCLATSSDPALTRAQHGIDAVHARDRRAVARRVASVDAVVIAGGTVFKTLPASCGRPPLALLRSALALALGARALGRPVAFVGVGAGRLDGVAAQWLVRALVRSADLLVVRDEESAASLAASGAPAPFRVGADPAWSLLEPPAATTIGSRERGAIVVALGRHTGGQPIASRLAHALEPLLRRGLRVRLQPWQVGDDAHDGGGCDDEAYAHAVAAELGAHGLEAEVLPPPADLADARELFAGARLVVATRFHATLAAAAAGVPFLALAHEHKLAGIARRLRQPALPADASAARIAEAIDLALDHAPAPVDAVHREVDAAREGFRLLRVLLSGGRSPESEDVGGLPLRPAEWAT